MVVDGGVKNEGDNESSSWFLYPDPNELLIGGKKSSSLNSPHKSIPVTGESWYVLRGFLILYSS